MSGQTALFLAVDGLGVLVSIRHLFILRMSSPWTSAGWLCWALFFAILFERAEIGPTFGRPWDYVLLGMLAVTFTVANVRKEYHGEPWWWPVRRAPSRLARRRPEDEP